MSSSATNMRSYSFRNARNREDAVQRLQRFVHCEVSFEATFHRATIGDTENWADV
jgi:hypothetical protein